MEQNYNNFVITFYKFLFDINRYVPTSELNKILEVYKDFDMKKVIVLVHKLLKNNEEYINTTNVNLFNNDLFMLPSFNLSQLWFKMNPNQQKKVWMYMSMLLLQTEIFFTGEDTNTQPVAEVKAVVPEFNPYVGIGGGGQDYGVNEMLSSIPTIDEDQPMGMGIGTIIKMTGLDKMIDINKFTDELKNMSSEDIDKSVAQMRLVLGPENNATGDLISSMLVSISDELKKDDGAEKNLEKILSAVTANISSSVAENNITVPQLINSAKAFASQCKTADGSPMFGGANPFALLEKCIGSNGQMNEQECAAECNNMLQNMGMGNVDLANMNPMNMAQMFSKMQQGGPQQPQQPKKGKKKRAMKQPNRK
jgi:hypothetical protein